MMAMLIIYDIMIIDGLHIPEWHLFRGNAPQSDFCFGF